MKLVIGLLLVIASLSSATGLRLETASGRFSVDDAAGQVWLADAIGYVQTSLGEFRTSDERYFRSVVEEPVADAFCAYPWQRLYCRDLQGQVDLLLELRCDGVGRLLARLSLINRTKSDFQVSALHVVKGLRPGNWDKGRGLGWEQFGTAPLKETHTFGSLFAVATNIPPLVAGPLTTLHALPFSHLTPVEGGLQLDLWQHCQDVTLPPGEPGRTSDLVYASPVPQVERELERYADLAANFSNARHWPANFAAWCSWYSGLVMNATLEGKLEETTLANAPIIAREFALIGFNCMRVVDDYLDRRAGDWPLINASQPDGYPYTFGKLAELGLRPGHWYDSQRVLSDSDLARRSPELLALGDDGKPNLSQYQGPQSPYGSFGFLDASVPEAAHEFEATAAKFRTAGSRYCFFDFIGETMISPNHSHDKTKTGPEVSRLALEAIRRGTGEDFFLLSQYTQAANWGIADAMRVATDSWGDQAEAYKQTLAALYLNRRLFFTDPDAWCPLKHSLDWDTAWGLWQGLSGTNMTVGADFRNLTPDREAMIKRILPPLNTSGRARDLWERFVPAVLEQSLSADGEDWRVVGLFNWSWHPVDLRLNLDRLWDDSLFSTVGEAAPAKSVGATSRKYLLWDVWNQRLLGVYGPEYQTELPETCGHQTLAVREFTGQPQLLSVGEHLGQGIEELERSVWLPAEKILVASTHGLRGVRDTLIHLYVPAGYNFVAVEATGKSLEASSPTPHIIQFTVPDRAGSVEWRAQFEGGSQVLTEERPVNPQLVAQVIFPEAEQGKLRARLPELSLKASASRLGELDQSKWALVVYASPSSPPGGGYEELLGFGLLAGNKFGDYRLPQWGMEPAFWFENEEVTYRVDGLEPDRSYRVGFTLLDNDTELRQVALSLQRISDGKRFPLASEVAEAPIINQGVKPELAWFDVPAEAVDPEGLVLSARHLAGANAIVAEFWVAVAK